MKGYVAHCESLADMHWKLWLWHHDEHRTEDAVWHHGRYQDWTRAAYAQEMNYDDDSEDDRTYVVDWWEQQGPMVLDDRTPHERTEYTHD